MTLAGALTLLGLATGWGQQFRCLSNAGRFTLSVPSSGDLVAEATDDCWNSLFQVLIRSDLPAIAD